MKEGQFNKRHEQKKVVLSFAFYNIGIVLVWSSFVAVFNLQSSINIEDAIGTTTIAVTFVIQILVATCFTPVAIRRYGVKIWLIAGDIAVLPYILANIYPRYFTLLPTGILLGALQANVWPSMCLINVLCATLYSNLSKRPKRMHTIQFSALFFASIQFAQVFGGMLAYVVLYGFDQIPVPSIESLDDCKIFNTTGYPNSTTCISNQTLYRFCGIHDCQNATIISETINQYKPLNKISLYVLIGICLLLAIVGTLFHIFLVPNDKAIEHKQTYYKSEMAKLARENGDNPEIIIGDEKEDTHKVQALYAPTKDVGVLKQCVQTVKAIWRHVTSVKLLLLLPITFYNGLSVSFILTEGTRAYTSCTLGVQWVGICMALYGLMDATFALIVGKFGRKLGRVALFTIAVMLETGNYIYALYWAPSEYLLFSVLIMFLTFGITDGILQPTINVTHIDFFPLNEDLALLVWNTVFLAALVVGYITSPLFCVSTRVYFNLGVLILGYAFVVAAELYDRRIRLHKIEPRR